MNSAKILERLREESFLFTPRPGYGEDFPVVPLSVIEELLTSKQG